jgi:hypothetical protein
MRTPFYTRFEDPLLQEAFVDELKRTRVPYLSGDHGTVGYGPDNWLDVMDAANKVRDAQFRWYLLMCRDDSEAAQLRQRLTGGGFRFFVEHSNSGTAFGVRREDEDALRRLPW